MNYYQFHIGDYIKTTSHLSIIEDLIYRRLMDMYYDSERPIPSDKQWVLRRLRVGFENMESLENVLSEFFTESENGWVNKRCQSEIDSYHAYIDKQKANGSKGGRPKKPTANPLDSQTKPKKSLTTNQEPLTTNHKPIGNGRFAPPHLQDVVDYMVERGEAPFPARSQSERFIDYYESKGWVVGKSKMKDWRAAVRNWMKNNFTNGVPNDLKSRSLVDDLTDTSWVG